MRGEVVGLRGGFVPFVEQQGMGSRVSAILSLQHGTAFLYSISPVCCFVIIPNMGIDDDFQVMINIGS